MNRDNPPSSSASTGSSNRSPWSPPLLTEYDVKNNTEDQADQPDDDNAIAGIAPAS